MKEVVIYTTRTCPFCRQAKSLLESKRVSYREIDVTDSIDMRERLVSMSAGRQTVPVIFIDGNCVGGYEELVRYFQEQKI